MSKQNQPEQQAQATSSFKDFVDKIMVKLGIPQHWVDKRFDQLIYEGSFIEHVTKIKEWDFEDPISITLTSQFSGIGKTHIGICLIRKYIHNELLAVTGDAGLSLLETVRDYYLSETDLFFEIQDTFKKTSFYSESDVINKYAKSKFLFLDDLFATRDNEFARRIVLALINKRIDWYRKPTFITTNLNASEIEAKDPRILSRLKNGWFITVNSESKDHRGKGKKSYGS